MRFYKKDGTDINIAFLYFKEVFDLLPIFSGYLDLQNQEIIFNNAVIDDGSDTHTIKNSLIDIVAIHEHLTFLEYYKSDDINKIDNEFNDFFLAIKETLETDFYKNLKKVVF